MYVLGGETNSLQTKKQHARTWILLAHCLALISNTLVFNAYHVV